MCLRSGWEEQGEGLEFGSALEMGCLCALRVITGKDCFSSLEMGRCISGWRFKSGSGYVE